MGFSIPDAKSVSGVGYYSSSNYIPFELMDRIDRMFEMEMPLNESPDTSHPGKLFKITVTVEEV